MPFVPSSFLRLMSSYLTIRFLFITAVPSDSRPPERSIRLDTRFRDLQRRGTEIAGDSTRCDFCNARSVHMEHKPVEANVRKGC